MILCALCRFCTLQGFTDNTKNDQNDAWLAFVWAYCCADGNFSESKTGFDDIFLSITFKSRKLGEIDERPFCFLQWKLNSSLAHFLKVKNSYSVYCIAYFIGLEYILSILYEEIICFISERVSSLDFMALHVHVLFGMVLDRITNLRRNDM